MRQRCGSHSMHISSHASVYALPCRMLRRTPPKRHRSVATEAALQHVPHPVLTYMQKRNLLGSNFCMDLLRGGFGDGLNSPWLARFIPFLARARNNFWQRCQFGLQ